MTAVATRIRPWHSPHEAPGDLSRVEAFQLEAFCDGSIMVMEIRHHLWQSWGLCHRHAWAFTVIEIETRLGRPFSTSILYDDLLRRAVDVVAWRAPWSRVLRRLRSRAHCFTCEYVRSCHADFVPPRDREHSVYINRLRATIPTMERSWDEAMARACPLCADGTGPMCRPHLVQGARVERRRLELELRALYDRMHGLHRSMPWGGPPATQAMQASWIEALGWFGGWSWPFHPEPQR